MVQISCRTKIDELLSIEYSKITTNDLMKVPSNIVAQYSAFLASQLSERTKVDNIVNDFKLDIISTIAETIRTEVQDQVKSAVSNEVVTQIKEELEATHKDLQAQLVVEKVSVDKLTKLETDIHQVQQKVSTLTQTVSSEKFNKIELDLNNMHKEVNNISNVVNNMSCNFIGSVNSESHKEMKKKQGRQTDLVSVANKSESIEKITINNIELNNKFENLQKTIEGMEKVVTSCEKQVSTFEGKITTISQNLIDRYTLADDMLHISTETKTNKPKPNKTSSSKSDQQNILQERAGIMDEEPETLKQLLDKQGEAINSIKVVTETSKTQLDQIETKIDTITTSNTDIKEDLGKLETKSNAENTKNLYSQKLLTIEQNTKATSQKTSTMRKEIVKLNLKNDRSQMMNGRESLPQAGAKGLAIEYDPNKTVLIKGIKSKQYFTNSIGLRRNLSKLFPLIAIDMAMTTTSGFIQYQFRTTEDAEHVYDNWKSCNYGGDTKAVRPQKQVSIGIARDVPIDYSEDDLKEEILESYAVTEVKRLKRNDKSLPVIKIFFDSADTLQEAMKMGIKLKEGLLLAVEESSPRGGRVIRCYQCQKFGHVQARCTNKIKCVKCGKEGHGHTETGEQKCTEGTDVKCANCGEQHYANSYSCSKFVEIRQLLNTKGRYTFNNENKQRSQHV